MDKLQEIEKRLEKAKSGIGPKKILAGLVIDDVDYEFFIHAQEDIEYLLNEIDWLMCELSSGD